jgi:hypothetical protein
MSEWMKYPNAVQRNWTGSHATFEQWVRQAVTAEERRGLEASGYRCYPVVVVRDVGKPNPGRVYLFGLERPTYGSLITAAEVLLEDAGPNDTLTLGDAEPPLPPP